MQKKLREFFRSNFAAASFFMCLPPCTLWCQLEDTVLLIGTLLLFDPVLFPKYEAWLLIGSIPNFEALLGAPLIKTTQHLLHIPLQVCLLIGPWLFKCLEAWLLIGTCLLIGTKEYPSILRTQFSHLSYVPPSISKSLRPKLRNLLGLANSS